MDIPRNWFPRKALGRQVLATATFISLWICFSLWQQGHLAGFGHDDSDVHSSLWMNALGLSTAFRGLFFHLAVAAVASAVWSLRFKGPGLSSEISAPSTSRSHELPIIFQAEPKIAPTIVGNVLTQ